MTPLLEKINLARYRLPTTLSEKDYFDRSVCHLLSEIGTTILSCPTPAGQLSLRNLLSVAAEYSAGPFWVLDLKLSHSSSFS